MEIPVIRRLAGHRRHAPFPLLLLVFTAASALAQEPAGSVGLSLQQTVELARENNPELLQTANDLSPARAAVLAAKGNAYLPGANVSTNYQYTASGQRRLGTVGFGEQPAFYSSGYSLGLQYSLNGSQLLQPSVARADERAAIRRIADTEQRLVANVTQQYLAVLRAEANAEQAAREVERTGEQVRLAEARREVGIGISLDVRRAEVEQGNAEVRLLQARAQREQDLLALGRTVGVAIPAGTRLVTDFDLFEPTLDQEALIDAALQSNPQLLASRATVDAAGTRVKQAKSEYLPSLSASVNVSGFAQEAADLDPLIASQLNEGTFQSCLDNNRIRAAAGLPVLPCLDPSDPAARQSVRELVADRNSGFPFGFTTQPWSASLTISLPVFDNFTRNLQVQQQQAALSDSRQLLRAQELQIRQDVGTAVLNIETAYSTAGILARARATAAEELRLAQARLQAGAANSLEVVDAQTRLSEAERAEIDAVYNFHQSLAFLEALVGTSLR